MSRLVLSFAIALATISPVFGTELKGPSQNEIMPVFFDLKTSRFPVVAEKNGQLFQVFVVKGQRPYFADAEGKRHFVFKKDGTASFRTFYMKGPTERGEEISTASSSEDENSVKTFLAKNGDDAKTQLVCWGRRYFGGGIFYGGAYGGGWGWGGYGGWGGYYSSYYGGYYRGFGYYGSLGWGGYGCSLGYGYGYGYGYGGWGGWGW